MESGGFRRRLKKRTHAQIQFALYNSSVRAQVHPHRTPGFGGRAGGCGIP